MIEVRIGVAEAPKELVVETEEAAAEVIKQVDAALGTGSQSMLWLTDKKGKQVGIPTSKIAYIEVDDKIVDRQVGFA